MVSSISSIPDAAFSSLDSMMGGAATATSGNSIMGALKSIGKFLQGDWGTSVGKAYRDAKKAGLTTGITDFSWKTAYNNYHTKAAADAAEEAAKIASGELKKGFFGKMFGGLKKYFGPIVTAIFFLPRIVKAFANDGIAEGLKETAKAAISLTAFAIGGVIVGMLGLTGIGGVLAALAIPMVVSMVADKGANMILGESKAEQRETLLAQQKEMQKQTPYQDIIKNDPVMNSLRNRIYTDSYANPYGSTRARNQYIA